MIDRGALKERVAELARARHATAVGIMLERLGEKAPRDSGLLASSITSTGVVESPGRITTTIAVPVDHASYQDKGTGIYGPRGVPITPSRSSVLVFAVKGASGPGAGRVLGGGGGFIFARSVKGSPATLFWSDTVTEDGWRSALEEASP